jgi:hypothetical protein
VLRDVGVKEWMEREGCRRDLQCLLTSKVFDAVVEEGEVVVVDRCAREELALASSLAGEKGKQAVVWNGRFTERGANH